MGIITKEDVVESITDGLQYISYYHPPDYIKNLSLAYELEESKPAKEAMAQILINSRMCAEGKRPICQDTGIVTVFCKVGMNVEWGFNTPLENLINEGVRRAYLHPENKLRASILSEPAGLRKNTKDNTPAVIHFEVIPGSANFLLCHTDSVRIPSSELVKKSKEFGLYIRDISLTSSFLGEYAVRIAVKSGQENSRIIEILKRSLDIL